MNKKWLCIFLIILSIFCVFSLYKNFQLETQLYSLKKDANKTDSAQTKTTNTAFELAPIMSRMQIYANKLWFAGNAKNWELAAFYVEEIEEAMEAIEKSNAKENGVLLSKAVVDWGLNPIVNLENTIHKKDKNLFITEYDMMTTNCNGCHIITKHNFIKIMRPTTPVFTNQKYIVQ